MNYKDKKVFSEIYDKYVADIYRYTVLKVNSAALAEDITSEVFFKAWQFILADGKKIEQLRPFLYKIARNQIIDYYRKKEKKDILLADSNGDETAESALEKLYAKNNMMFDAAREYSTKDDIREVKNIIDKLDDKYKEIILLYYLDGFDCKEIAKIMGKTSVGVRVALHRAVKKVKKILKIKNM